MATGSYASVVCALLLAGVAHAAEPTSRAVTSTQAVTTARVAEASSLPTRDWRAVHLMAWGTAGGSEAIGPIKRAIAEVLAPLGVNVIIFEVDYNYDFASRPDLRHAPFITRADARELVAVCREHGIALIPQFNCVGHQSWVRTKTLFPLLAKYPELEEPPDADPAEWDRVIRAWCPFHPRVKEIVYPMLDELIEVFEAEAFHVGMDEVMVVASDKCPRCKGRDPADWFAVAVADLYQYLVREKGLTMLMWGDRLLDAEALNANSRFEASHSGTAGAIDRIPKDIIVCDWHYYVQPDYPSVRLFQEKGFRVLPASWQDVKAVEALIECARRDATERMLGHLCTSWTLEPGAFARALLGEGKADGLSDLAVGSAAGVKAALRKLQAIDGER